MPIAIVRWHTIFTTESHEVLNESIRIVFLILTTFILSSTIIIYYTNVAGAQMTPEPATDSLAANNEDCSQTSPDRTKKFFYYNNSKLYYNASKLGLSIICPNDWNLTDQTDQNVSLIMRPPLKKDAFFRVIALPAGIYDLTYNIGIAINEMKNDLVNFTIVESQGVTITNNGISAQRIVYTHMGNKTNPQPNTFKSNVTFTAIGNILYTIQYQAEFDKYDTYLPIINNITDSIDFRDIKSIKATSQSGLRLDASPVDLAINPTTGMLYVAVPETDKVYVMDATTNIITSKIRVGGIPSSLAINTLTNTIYVASLETDKIYVIDGFTNKIVDEIQAGLKVGNLAIDTNEFGGFGGLIFAANNENNTVSVIDGTKNIVIKNVTTDSPHSIAIDSITNKAYITNMGSSHSVSVIDYVTYPNHSFVPDEMANIVVGGFPTGIDIDLHTNKIYITNSAEDNIAVIDGNNLTKPPYRVKVGLFPSSLAINSNNSKLYVANTGENTISIMDLSTEEVKPLPVNSVPYDVAINSKTNMIYLANYESNTISTIDGSTNELAVSITFNIKPQNAGLIICNDEEIPTNTYIRIESGARCIAKANNGFAFSSWTENLSSNSSRTINMPSHTDSPVDWIKSVLGFSSKQTPSILTVTKYGSFTANFIRPIEEHGNTISFIALASFITLPALFSARPSILTNISTRFFSKVTKKLPKLTDLKDTDILGINVAVIAGVLIFLSLEGFEGSERTQITFITANIVFPFAASTIVTLLNFYKFGMRLTIAGFVNLMVSIILIAIMRF